MKKTLAYVLAALMVFAVPLSALAETAVIFTPWGNTSTAEDTKMVEEKLEEMMKEDGLDIDIDWIITPTDGSLEKFNVMVTSTQIDAVSMNIGDAKTYLTDGSGLVKPLNALLEEYGKNLLEMIPDAAWIPCTDSNGNIWCIPDYYQWIWQGAVIRTDLLAECNLEMPTTVAELENVMAVFHEKYPDMMLFITSRDDLKTLQYLLHEILSSNVSMNSRGAVRLTNLDGKAIPSQSLKMAAVMVATVPVLCVYPFLQKYFVHGIMIGSLKE